MANIHISLPSSPHRCLGILPVLRFCNWRAIDLFRLWAAGTLSACLRLRLALRISLVIVKLKVQLILAGRLVCRQ